MFRAIVALAASASLVAAQAPTQITLHPSFAEGELSVDFVGVAGQANGAVQFGAGGASKTLPTTNFLYSSIGQMHQGVMNFVAAFGLTAGQPAWYRVTADSATWSANFSVTPIGASLRRRAGRLPPRGTALRAPRVWQCRVAECRRARDPTSAGAAAPLPLPSPASHSHRPSALPRAVAVPRSIVFGDFGLTNDIIMQS